MTGGPVRLVTIGGECFEAELRSVNEYGERDGLLHKFYLTDMVGKRGKRLVSVFISGTLVATGANYESRAEIVRLNAIRRAFDQAILSFDAPLDELHYTEVSLSPQDFQTQQARTDAEIRRYIIYKAYWLAYRFPIHAQPGDILYPIPFDEPADLDYLGVTATEVWRNIQRMKGQGLLEKVLEGLARPSELLLSRYESGELLGRELPAATSVSTGAAEDRKFAQLAIEEARKSAPEDSRIHPKVGVVVVKDGRILATAHRGEIPQCHAEFIALEKKLTDVALLGATVYTTLEPCTARNHPKVPCAIRLTERKVTRVVIGMLDPDDRISGRGQRTLRKAGIATELFADDLMAEVEELNREFVRDRESLESELHDGPAQKPKGRVHFVPDAYNCGWARSEEQMEVRVGGTFTYDGAGTLTVLRAFLEGTQPIADMMVQVITSGGLGTTVSVPHLDLGAHAPIRAFINVRVTPARGIRGETLNSRFVLSDNYNREYTFDVSLPYIDQK